MTDKLFDWFIFVFLFLLVTVLSALALWGLWNWLSPIFWTSAPMLTFLQSWGIIVFIILIRNIVRIRINLIYKNNDNKIY